MDAIVLFSGENPPQAANIILDGWSPEYSRRSPTHGSKKQPPEMYRR